jgi:hypothetical protein
VFRKPLTKKEQEPDPDPSLNAMDPIASLVGGEGFLKCLINNWLRCGYRIPFTILRFTYKTSS